MSAPTSTSLYGPHSGSARILTVQVAMPTGDGDFFSAFAKQPHHGDVRLFRDHLEGDGQADREHHGGADKAMLLYASSHYPLWRDEFPSLPWQGGSFGENLTVSELTEETVCIGDVLTIGSALVQVSQPRIPCWKIDRRWNRTGLTDRVRETGRTGFYVRVLREGSIRAEMPLTLLERTEPELTVALANDVLTGRCTSPSCLEALVACPTLAATWRDMLAPRLEGRRSS